MCHVFPDDERPHLYIPFLSEILLNFNSSIIIHPTTVMSTRKWKHGLLHWNMIDMDGLWITLPILLYFSQRMKTNWVNHLVTTTERMPVGSGSVTSFHYLYRNVYQWCTLHYTKYWVFTQFYKRLYDQGLYGWIITRDAPFYSLL